jgi:hypothetical protein
MPRAVLRRTAGTRVPWKNCPCSRIVAIPYSDLRTALTSDSVFFGYHAKIGVINQAKGASGRFIRLSEADPEKNSLPCPFKLLCAQKLDLKLGGRHSSPGRELRASRFSEHTQLHSFGQRWSKFVPQAAKSRKQRSECHKRAPSSKKLNGQDSG